MRLRRCFKCEISFGSSNAFNMSLTTISWWLPIELPYLGPTIMHAHSRAPQLAHSPMIMAGIPAVANQDFECTSNVWKTPGAQSCMWRLAKLINKQHSVNGGDRNVTKEDVIVVRWFELWFTFRRIDLVECDLVAAFVLTRAKHALRANAAAPTNALAESKITMKRSTKNEQQHTNETNHLIATVKLIMVARRNAIAQHQQQRLNHVQGAALSRDMASRFRFPLPKKPPAPHRCIIKKPFAKQTSARGTAQHSVAQYVYVRIGVLTCAQYQRAR